MKLTKYILYQVIFTDEFNVLGVIQPRVKAKTVCESNKAVD